MTLLVIIAICLIFLGYMVDKPYLTISSIIFIIALFIGYALTLGSFKDESHIADNEILENLGGVSANGKFFGIIREKNEEIIAVKFDKEPPKVFKKRGDGDYVPFP